MDAATMTDAELVQASVSGNRRAFGTIIERYKSLVCAVTYSATGDLGSSEDLAQETFIIAWSHLGNVNDPGRLGAWLCGIARNLSQRWLRKQQRDVMAHAGSLKDSPGHAAADPTPREAAIEKEQQTTLWQTLESIPESYRVPLILFYREGQSVQRVAQTLGLSPDAAKQRLSRGRRMLKTEVERFVEQSLAGTRPGKRFSLGVLSALPGPAIGAATAGAGAHAVIAGHQAPSAAVGKILSGSVLLGAKQVGGAAIVLALVLGLGAVVRLNKTGSVSQAALAPEKDVLSIAGDDRASAESARKPAEQAPNGTVRTQATPGQTQPEPVVAALPKTVAPAYDGPPPREVAPAGYPGTQYDDSITDLIQGVVYDPSGRPLGAAKVWVARFGKGARDTRETVADTAGRFAFRLPPGQWCIQARKGFLGGEADTGFAGQLITEGHGQSIPAAIRTKKWGRVYGRIYDKETGLPIPHGQIWTKSRILVTADSKGRYEIEGQRPGYHTLIALCPGYERKYVIYSPVLREEWELDLFLERAGKVSGRVVDPQGRPLAHAWVCKYISGHEVCDENGRFEFDGLPFGRDVKLQAQMPYYENVCRPIQAIEGKTIASQRVSVPKPWATTAEVQFVLDPVFQEEVRREFRWDRAEARGAIAGRVVGPDGMPVRNFRILTQDPHAEVDRSQAAEIEINEYYTGYSFTSDDGSFRICPRGCNGYAEPGKVVRLVALADGYGEAVADIATVRPVNSLSASVPVLLRLALPRRLSVKVTEEGSAGNPVAGARVTVREINIRLDGAFEWHTAHSAMYRPVTMVTDSLGWARFTNLSLGEGVVLVEREGYARSNGVCQAGERVLSMELEPQAVIEGQVFDEAGESIHLYWAGDGTYDPGNPDHENSQVKLEPQGGRCFRIDQLPAGAYKLKVYGDRDGRYRAIHTDTFRLDAGEILKVRYPDDAIAYNLDAWLAEGTGEPGDQALQEKLIGAWYRDGFSGSGAPVRVVCRFGENARRELWIFTAGYSRIYAAGTFKVEAGCIRIALDNGGLLDFTKVEFPDPDTLILGTTGGHAEDPYQRTDQLETVLRQGEMMSRPVPAVTAAANPHSHRKVTSYSTSSGTFTQEE